MGAREHVLRTGGNAPAPPSDTEVDAVDVGTPELTSSASLRAQPRVRHPAARAGYPPGPLTGSFHL